MKKLIFFACMCLFIVSCRSYRTLDLNRLTTGMSKAEVRSVVGRPYRVLAVNDTKDGYQEVLEYRTRRDEIYALEFWNDYLTGYEYLYDDLNYIPPLYPPLYYPEYGRPIIVYPLQPGRPNRPSNPNPPTRPDASRPGNTKPDRPQVSTPQNNQSTITRPSTGSGTSTTTRPETSGSQRNPSGTPRTSQ